ncbi:hypothetical protein OROMI_033398 [Orobanche minor]
MKSSMGWQSFRVACKRTLDRANAVAERRRRSMDLVLSLIFFTGMASTAIRQHRNSD